MIVESRKQASGLYPSSGFFLEARDNFAYVFMA
jgi:hypothetical protein